MKQVDIIIPIYNAYDDLNICLESLYKNTDLKKNRLILINDKSSDERMRPYLDSQKKENVIVIHNEENQGFSGNINIGMAQSEENDVILLNSDTILTKGWVEKMVECAYANPSTGTVTPLSNNATLCSVPEFCEENRLPEGMTVEEAGELIERISFKRYPVITVAHGFCMLIKREVIKKIGNFDAATFEKGYGEENDFCNRAMQLGYQNVMCDNTYIYHSGTKSFLSKEKEERILAHDKILRERYPDLMQRNAEYCAYNPNKDICDNVAMYMDLYCKGKKNILYLVQADFRDGAPDNRGGTQLHVKDLTYGLRQHYNVYVAAREGKMLYVTAYFEDRQMQFRFPIGEAPIYPAVSMEASKKVYHNILNAFRIDLVHVHHTYGLTQDLFYEADRLHIPVILTVHDFYYVCPTIKLLDENNKVCIGCETEEKCRVCLKKNLNIMETVPYLKEWRNNNRKVLEICKKIITPSENAKQILCEYYPEIKEKVTVIEHGVDYALLYKDMEKQSIKTVDTLKYHIEKVEEKNTYAIAVKGWAIDNKHSDDTTAIWLRVVDEQGSTDYIPCSLVERGDVAGENHKAIKCGFEGYLPEKYFGKKVKIIPVLETKMGAITTEKDMALQVPKKNKHTLKVAFIGGLNEAKGSQQVTGIIKNGPKDVEYYIFGGIGDGELFNLKQPNLTKTGAYRREELATLLSLHQIDVLCILSRWPETYCYTLSESLLCKIPVIAVNVGALGERTKEMNCGWIVDVNTAESEVMELLKSLKEDHKLLEEKKHNIETIALKTIDEMVQEYDALYQGNMADMIVYETFEPAYIYDNRYEGHGKICTGVDDEEVEYLRGIERQYKHLQKTIAYKFMMKLQRASFPGRRALEKTLKKTMK